MGYCTSGIGTSLTGRHLERAGGQRQFYRSHLEITNMAEELLVDMEMRGSECGIIAALSQGGHR